MAEPDAARLTVNPVQRIMGGCSVSVGSTMNAQQLVAQLAQGTVLEGPHWPESVRVLAAKARGNRVEIQAVGLIGKRLWTKLLGAEEFEGKIKITAASDVASLTGDPTQFRLAAEAHRIRLAFQYDPHFAVSVSQVDPLPHQMDAVYGHLLTQPKIRFLLADDPGAGKTIMAGLLLKELKYRGLVQRTLIVTPANLTDQWRRELHEKFTETFTVVNRATVGAAYGKNVWEDNPQCITSIDFVFEAGRHHQPDAGGALGLGDRGRSPQDGRIQIRPED